MRPRVSPGLAFSTVWLQGNPTRCPIQAAPLPGYRRSQSARSGARTWPLTGWRDQGIRDHASSGHRTSEHCRPEVALGVHHQGRKTPLCLLRQSTPRVALASLNQHIAGKQGTTQIRHPKGDTHMAIPIAVQLYSVRQDAAALRMQEAPEPEVPGWQGARHLDVLLPSPYWRRSPRPAPQGSRPRQPCKSSASEPPSLPVEPGLPSLRRARAVSAAGTVDLTRSGPDLA